MLSLFSRSFSVKLSRELIGTKLTGFHLPSTTSRRLGGKCQYATSKFGRAEFSFLDMPFALIFQPVALYHPWRAVALIGKERCPSFG